MKLNPAKTGITVLLPILFGMVYSCGTRSEASADDDISHTTTVVLKTNVSGELLLPGELEGYYETGILAKVNGYIKIIYVDIGDHVSEGQLLAKLEAPELVSQVAAGFSEYRAKEAIYMNTSSRYVRLSQTDRTPGAVSPYDMELARTNIVADSLAFIAARAKYESMRQLTDYLLITAPFEGIITERSSSPGAFVGPGDKNANPILKLRNESKLRLHVAVPEIHISEIRAGDTVKFSVKSFPDIDFQGVITRLSKNVQASTRSEIIEIEIKNEGNRLLPGMYAKAIIPIKRPGMSLTVPQSSVLINMERSFVIRVQGGTQADWIDVRKGEIFGDRVEIFGKLNAGDTLITVATDEIKDHSKIKTTFQSE